MLHCETSWLGLCTSLCQHLLTFLQAPFQSVLAAPGPKRFYCYCCSNRGLEAWYGRKVVREDEMKRKYITRHTFVQHILNTLLPISTVMGGSAGSLLCGLPRLQMRGRSYISSLRCSLPVVTIPWRIWSGKRDEKNITTSFLPTIISEKQNYPLFGNSKHSHEPQRYAASYCLLSRDVSSGMSVDSEPQRTWPVRVGYNKPIAVYWRSTSKQLKTVMQILTAIVQALRLGKSNKRRMWIGKPTRQCHRLNLSDTKCLATLNASPSFVFIVQGGLLFSQKAFLFFFVKGTPLTNRELAHADTFSTYQQVSSFDADRLRTYSRSFL